MKHFIFQKFDPRFVPHVKLAEYHKIFEALDMLSSQRQLRVCTLPGLGCYFEEALIKRYPNIILDCLEMDQEVYNRIKGNPIFSQDNSRINLYFSDVVKFLENHNDKYDLFNLDFCGWAPKNICEVVNKHLSNGGIFAITECKGRTSSANWFKNTIPNCLHQIINPAEYWFMRFHLLVKNRTVKQMLPCDLKTIYKYGRRIKELYDSSISNPLSIKELFEPKGQTSNRLTFKGSLNIKAVISRLKILFDNNSACLRKFEKDLVSLRVSGLSPKEIAKKTDKTVNQVYSMLGYARTKMIKNAGDFHRTYSKLAISRKNFKGMTDSLKEVLKSIPEKDQQIFKMYYRDKMTQKEIALKLGWKSDSVICLKLKKIVDNIKSKQIAEHCSKSSAKISSSFIMKEITA